MRRSTHFPQFSAPSQEPPPFVPLGRAEVVGRDGARVRLRTVDGVVELTALGDGIVRVGLFGEGQPVAYDSAAVIDDPGPAAHAQQSDASDGLCIETDRISARIQLDPLRIGFTDADGRPLAEDDPELGMGFAPLAAGLLDPLGAPARVYKRHAPGTRYFGCGERTGGLEKTGSHQVFWNVDPPIGHTAALNNLYTSVPFVLALQDGRAWGLFVDSGYRLEFDLARAEPTRCGFGVDGGPLIYYVFAGPTPRDVLEQYTRVTGRIPMPPRWALGNHQSRWGYTTADEMIELADTFRREHIPLDVLYLDIDYMDGYRVFTWDRTRFPDPAGLVRELAQRGVKLVTIIDPGVKVDEDYAVYTQGRQADLFCRTFFGAEYHNVVWPGMCAFPDFTNPRTRAWWADLHRGLIDAGVAGIWCDMNEPTVFIPTPQTLPDDVAHHGDGNAAIHAQVHNLYGMLMARAAQAGLRKYRPEKRPFVISRAGFAGLQRYALHWTGDNSSWWEHLWMSMPQLQNLGLSGFAWVGVDVGGFAGDATGELLTRWTEFGIFQPFCRNHSARNTRRQEPWAFGEPYKSHLRELLRLRQRLVPYLYTLFEEAHRTGAPILRPLLFEWPADPATCSADDEFLLGSALLVAPITRPAVEHRHVYLPSGTWVQLWTGEWLEGPAHVLAHAPLGRPAIYVRANTPVPLWPALEYDGERAPDPLTWLVCIADAAPGTGDLYLDAGDGYAFESGDLRRTRVECRVSADVVDLGFEHTGSYAGPDHVELEIRGLRRPSQITIDGAPHSDWDHTDDRLIVRLSGTPRIVQIRRT